MGDSLSTRWGLDDSILANGIYTNAVYFPNQRIRLGDSPGMLDFGCVNHVYYAYAALRRDGTVYVSA